MDSFLERYYQAIDRECGDPHTSTRYPKADRLADLYELDQNLFDQLLKVAGMESLMGYTEATITLVSGQIFYTLPPGFRQFIQLEYRQDNYVTKYLRSKSFYKDIHGVDILSSERGFRLFPPPSITEDQEWTICYLRAPGYLHYAKAARVSADGKAVVSGTPPDDGGELYLVDDYYNGVELRIYASDNNAHPQTRVVSDFVITGSSLRKQEGVFHLREALSPVPEGNIYYEICPTVPLRYDKIYALSAAIAELRRRDKHVKAESLEKEWRKKWVGCTAYFSSNTLDRGPERLHPLKPEDMMPMNEIPYA